MGSTSKAVAQKNYDAQIETNKSNERNVDKTNAANLSLAQQQNAWNVQQWERNNAYNDPSAQLMRLKNAGLSSAAAAQSVAGVPASPVQSAEFGTQQPAQAVAPQYNLADSAQMNPANIIGIGRQFAGMMSDFANADIAQKEAKAADDFIWTRNDVQRSTLNRLRQDFSQKAEAWPYSLNALKYTSVKAMHDAKGAFLDNEGKQVDNLTRIENYNRAKTENKFLASKSEAEIRALGQQIKESEARISNLRADTNLKNQESRSEELKQAYQSLVNDLTKFGTPDSQAQKVAAMVATGNLSSDQVETALKATRDYIISGRDHLMDNTATKDYYRFVFNEGYAGKPQNQFTGQFDRIMEFAGDAGSFVKEILNGTR